MQFEKSERDQILKIFNRLENMGFINKLNNFFYCLIPCAHNENLEINWCLFLIKIVPFIFTIISFISPYYMLFILIICSYPAHLIFLSIITAIFFAIAYIGILGKGMVYCLTYPSNWFFLMFCGDFISIICNCFMFYYLKKLDNLNNFVVLGSYATFGNNLFCIIFFFQHFKVYKKINVIFTELIFMELDCIYYGSHEIFNCPGVLKKHK